MGPELSLLAVLSVPVMIGLAALWLTTRTRLRRAEETIAELKAQGEADVVSMIHGISAHIERLEESQRFMTELLAKRPDHKVLRASPEARSSE